ncbi:ribosome quality control complex subunit NEMF homolog [Eupeodes corollae]|uniref:ribosome quality control complex subunit NEMF homolog n=1 Tax=Eupeodes corollae TaxID=290404 RepID=UPI0024902EFE|nr:ribosome quality control complex subunit NEMF homolog [Eupeodes corollae]
MKTRFNSFDIVCGVTELQKLVGLRVNQIYDIDNKTFLIRLQQHETKCVLLLESGIRFHTTAFEWPKNMAPSGFSMKLRKHLKNKRLEKLTQLGVDRIVDFQFGMNEAAYHIILELYDRGNIILTDHEMNILYILRPHYEGEEVRFAVREKYPTNRAREASEDLTEEKVKEVLASAKAGDNLRKILFPYLDCGPTVIEHVLVKNSLIDCVFKGSADNAEDNETDKADQKKTRKQKKKEAGSANARPFDMEADLPKLMVAIQDANAILNEGRTLPPKGYLIQKKEAKPTEAGEPQEFLYQNIEYHPYKFEQFNGQPCAEHESFMFAVDEFYSTLEGQKIDMKTLHQEREALKKLSNVKKDHAKRLEELTKVQEVDKQRAELITRNQALVDNAILAIRSAIANQMSWPDIHELVKAAQTNGDPVASTIKQLKLEINHISLLLADPYRVQPYDDEDEEEDEEEDDDYIPTMAVDVDLALSAWANARKFYDQKRNAAKKEQKTIDASQKALKSAERKTQQTLKDVRTISTISKARKVYWFEKFYWFISSENYLVIGGRDAQQNELIVKRYMRPTDIYVHAEIQGASSVVIRNPTGAEVPPKTLLEAGTMAISYSVAWDAKVVTNAYWVKSDQVSKTAPTGEYLGTGSFMIRGKKNFLPPCHLILGLSLLYKLEDSFIEKHRGERRVRTFDDDGAAADKLKEMTIENEQLEPVAEDVEIELEASDNEDSKKNDDDEVVKKSPESSDNEDDGKYAFPDTEVKVDHATGEVIVRLHSQVEPTTPLVIERISKDEDEEKPFIIPAVAPRKKQQQNAKKRKEEKVNQQQQKQQQQINHQKEENQSSNQMKRRQRGKLKKIKSKYRDQDDEERQLRMNILKSAGTEKAKIDSNKMEEDTNKLNKMKRQFEPKQPSNVDGEDETEDVTVSADVDMLDSLTGIPFEEDELLFAIPVVAPYQALHNYKFKVKLTPGTGKRGRAAKTAILMFSKDKSCTVREKDLLKGIKDEQLARNMPGKVKLSAPQLQKYKK